MRASSRIGAAEGIDFAFDAIKVAPNTLDAHRLLRWATSLAPACSTTSSAG